jgi:hypothetical protein
METFRHFVTIFVLFHHSRPQQGSLIHIKDDCCWQYPSTLTYLAKMPKIGTPPRWHAGNTSFWLETRNYTFFITSLWCYTSIWPSMNMYNTQQSTKRAAMVFWKRLQRGEKSAANGKMEFRSERKFLISAECLSGILFTKFHSFERNSVRARTR